MLQAINTTKKMFTFSLFYCLCFIGVEFLLALIGVSGFSATPYIKMSTFVFIGCYFYLYFVDFRIYSTIPIRFLDEAWFAFFWVLLTILCFIIGIANSNPIVYVVGDFVNIILGGMLFAVGYTVASQNRYLIPDAVLYKFSRVSTYLLIFTLVPKVVQLGFDLGTPAHLMIFNLCLAVTFFLVRQYKYFLIVFIPLVLSVPLSNRSFLISLMVAIVLLVLRLPRRGSKFPRFFSIFILVIGALLVIFIIFNLLLTYMPEDSSIYFRLYQFKVILLYGFDTGLVNVTSIKQRFVEAELVINNINTPFYNLLFGGGEGATIDGSLLVDESVTNAALLGNNIVHNIHFLPFALMNRYGVLGLFLFIMLVFHMFKAVTIVVNWQHGDRNYICLISNLFFIFWFVFSLAASNFLWSNPSLKNKKYYM